MKKLEEYLVAKAGVGGSAIGAINGAAIDTAGYSEAMIVLVTGLIAATGTLDVKVQDSADGSTGWADVTGAAFAQLVAADDYAVKVGRLKLDGNGIKRYIRVVSTVGTATADHGVSVILGGSQYSPQVPAFSVIAAP